MDMGARRQYFEILQEEYHKTKKREEKTAMLNEYCKNTKQNRKYVIQKFNCFLSPAPFRKKRPEIYDSRVIVALHKMWKIFDKPCGQRLKPSLKKEIVRLRTFGEIKISDTVVEKLKKISPPTIDRKLKFYKNKISNRRRYDGNNNPLLYQKIKIKTIYEQDRKDPGFHQMDIVEHCGASAAGTYGCSVNLTNLSFGWTETEAIMGKGQENALSAFEKIRQRCPVEITEIHPDNDSSFINWHLVKFCEDKKIEFSRSRPFKKNDNGFIEQKNSTNVRKVFGHLRYDTEKEIEILNDLYHNELRLYKNFFQPIMFLKEKKRIKSKIIRKYDEPKTPFERIIESKSVPDSIKQKLSEIYQNLNPAELKRQIDKKIRMLFDVHQKKTKNPISPFKKQIPNMKTFGKVLYDSTSTASVR